MHFATPTTFPWDFAILMVLTLSLSMAIVANTWLKRHPTSVVRSTFLWLLGLASVWVFLIVGYGSFIEPQIITVTVSPITIGSNTAPLKIAVLSDLHLGPYKGAGFAARVVKKVNALYPDIILLAGDYVLEDKTISEEDLLQKMEPLRALKPSIGTFAILGNHDHGIHRTFLGQLTAEPDYSSGIHTKLIQMGITVLENRSAVVELGRNKLAIIGVGDPFSRSSNIEKAFEGVPYSMPSILLTHTPDVILDPLSKRANVIVAGHTHAGQIRIPGLGAVATLPLRASQKYDQGLFKLDEDTTLAITRGVGESGPRARLFAPPQILLLTTGETNEN